MAFKLKSGNKPNFKAIGSSPLRQPTETEWKQQTSVGSDWLMDDLKSPGYEERLQREIKSAGKDDYIKAAPRGSDKYYSKISDAQEILEERINRAKNTKYHIPGETKDGRQVPAQAWASHAHNKSLKEGSDIYYSGNPRYDWQGSHAGRVEDLTIHEGAHSISAGQHGMLENTKNLLTDAKGGDASKGNINRPQEVYARYKVAQNFLQKQGIFDAFSGEKFTNKHVEQVEKMMKGVNKDNFREKGIPYEVFTFFGDDKKMKGHGFNKKISKKDMKTIFNNVATNEPDPGQIIDDSGQAQTFV